MTWNEFTKKDSFREASPELRQEIKRQYFGRQIAPKLQTAQVPEQELQSAFLEFMETPDDTGEGAFRSATSAFARGALRPLSDIPIAVGALTGSEGIEDFGKDIQGGIESAFPVNPAQEGFFTTEIPAVAGQVTSMIGTGLGAGAAARALAGSTAAAKLGAKAAVGTQAFTGGAAGGAQRADELGLEGGQKQLRALIGGGTELAAEALPFGMALETGAVRKLLGETIEGGWMSPVIKGTATEAVEEGIAETAGQATDIAFAPEQSNMDLQQIGKAMLLGGVGGAMFGGVNAAIAPKTAEAFKYEGEFVRVRDINEAPAEVQQQFAVGDTSRLVLDKRGKVIGYKPAAETIEADMPTEVIVPADIAPEIVPEVTQMVEGLAQNPTVPQVSKALAEDFGTGAPPVAPQPNLLTGAPGAAPVEVQNTEESNVSEGEAEEPITESPSVVSDSPSLSDIAGNNEKEFNEAKEVIGPRVPGLEVVLGDEFGLAPISVSPDGKQLRIVPSFLRRLKDKFKETWESVLDLVIDEEVFHSKDIASRGGEDAAQQQWADEWNSASKDVKDLVSKAYRGFNKLTDAQKGAELARMRDQASRLGKITESASDVLARKEAADN